MHLHFSHRHLARFILLALLTFLALLGGTTSSASASPASPPASPAPGSPPSTLSSISLRSEQPFTPAALFFPVSQVRLLDGPFKRRYDANARYLIDLLDPDRLLAPYRAQADLPPRAPFYGGWESRNSGASGHTLGHYLTALAYLQATTDDDKTRAEARRRVDYIVAELTACHRAKGTGAIMPVAPRATFPLPDIPVPFYNLHKLLAGLRDAYELAGNQNALALSRSIADWLDTLLRPLTRQQIQHMLAREYGGMNEVLADLAADTHDPRYLRMASAYFHRDALLAPLYRGEDHLGAQHANAQIPILAGLAREYELTGDPRYRAAATAFWNHVVNDRSYVTGGHGESEHFFPPAQFPGKLTSRTCETCNTNNMLKLTRHLFEWAPDAAQMDYVERALINHLAANIGERPGEFGYFLPLCSVAVKAYSKPLDAFWCCVGTGMENPAKYADQIYAHAAALSSPAGGVHAASYPVAAAAFTPPPIPALYINQYIASTLDYSEAALRLTMETQFPDSDTIRIKITTADHAPRHFTLNLRHPAWCAAPEITITTPQKTAPVGASLATPSAPLSNPVSVIPAAPPEIPPSVSSPTSGGTTSVSTPSSYPVAAAAFTPPVPAPASYLVLTRDWNDGDLITLRLPMTLHAEPLPHTDNKIIALLYGPAVLAAIIPGPKNTTRYSSQLNARCKTDSPPPLIVAPNITAALANLHPVEARFAEFRADGLFRPDDPGATRPAFLLSSSSSGVSAAPTSSAASRGSAQSKIENPKSKIPPPAPPPPDYTTLTLIPLHRVYEQQYAVYFPLLTPAEWPAREAQIRAAQQAQQTLAAATLATITPGDPESETAHALRAERSHPGKAFDRPNRNATDNGWFSYDMPVTPDAPVTLIATYWGGLWDERHFDITIDGRPLATQRLYNDSPGDFIDIPYAIPPDWTRDKTKVTIRFTARPKTAELYTLRTVRTAAIPPSR